MLDMALDVASWACIVTGGLFMVAGAIGVLRLPDFFSRQHAAGITDTLAAWLILLGLMLQLPAGLGTVKLLFILVFLFLTSPTATHALAQAALSQGLEPKADDLRKSG